MMAKLSSQSATVISHCHRGDYVAMYVTRCAIYLTTTSHYCDKSARAVELNWMTSFSEEPLPHSAG